MKVAHIKIVTVIALVNLLLLSSCSYFSEIDYRSKYFIILAHNSFFLTKTQKNELGKLLNKKIMLVNNDNSHVELAKLNFAKNRTNADLILGIPSVSSLNFIELGISSELESKFLKIYRAKLQNIPIINKRLVPIDFGSICVNYDVGWFTEHNIIPPHSWSDLTKPAYSGLLTMPNALSTEGRAALAATNRIFQTKLAWHNYWQNLRNNKVKVVDSWSTAYNGDFTLGSSRGNYPLVLSYNSSPYYEYLKKNKIISRNIFPTCAPIVEYGAVLERTENLNLAEKAINYFLGESFQKTVLYNLSMQPARKNIPLPSEFRNIALSDTITYPVFAEATTVSDDLIYNWQKLMEQN